MAEKEVLITKIVNEQLANIDGILDILQRKGKKMGGELVLLFYFLSNDEKKLKNFETKLVSLGFIEEDLYEDEEEFSLDIEWHTTCSKTNIVDIITTVATLCVAFNVEFDGWEAEI